MWRKCSENAPVIAQVNQSQHSEHDKPDEHQWTKQFADGRSTKLLQEKQQHQYAEYNHHNGILRDVFESWDDLRVLQWQT